MKTYIAASVLCLDLGTQTGWALYHNGKIISGSKSFKPRQHEGGGMRYVRFRREFLNKFTSVREIHFEEVHRHLGTDAAHIFGGHLATLTAFCEEHSIPYRGVGVGVWKKASVGKGNASKAEVIKSVKAKGFDPIDDNEADALALLDYVMMGIK